MTEKLYESLGAVIEALTAERDTAFDEIERLTKERNDARADVERLRESREANLEIMDGRLEEIASFRRNASKWKRRARIGMHDMALNLHHASQSARNEALEEAAKMLDTGSWTDGPHMRAAQAIRAMMRPHIGSERAQDTARDILEDMVRGECEYMTINNLGDPEKQHNVKRARAIGIKPHRSGSGRAQEADTPPSPPHDGAEPEKAVSGQENGACEHKWVAGKNQHGDIRHICIRCLACRELQPMAPEHADGDIVAVADPEKGKAQALWDCMSCNAENLTDPAYHICENCDEGEFPMFAQSRPPREHADGDTVAIEEPDKGKTKAVWTLDDGLDFMNEMLRREFDAAGLPDTDTPKPLEARAGTISQWPLCSVCGKPCISKLTDDCAEPYVRTGPQKAAHVRCAPKRDYPSATGTVEVPAALWHQVIGENIPDWHPTDAGGR